MAAHEDEEGEEDEDDEDDEDDEEPAAAAASAAAFASLLSAACTAWSTRRAMDSRSGPIFLRGVRSAETQRRQAP